MTPPRPCPLPLRPTWAQALRQCLATGLMVLAMAVENSVFLRDGEVGVSLTYMTGTLIKTCLLYTSPSPRD